MFQAFELYVYDKNLTFKGIIDEFISLRWRRKYFEAGEFELHVAFSKKIEEFLHEDFIIARTDAKEAGIIEYWQIIDSGDVVEVAIIGRFLSSILDRRIIRKRINFTGSLLDGERKLLTEMTPFSNLEIKETELKSEKITFQCTYKEVYSYLINLSKTSTIAHRIIPDFLNKKLIYENYQGLDRTESQIANTRYEFSDDKSNIENVEYTYNAKDKKNYVLVGGSGEGDDRILVEVSNGQATDLDLREVFVDASGEQMTEGTSLEDYKEQLKTIGRENLKRETEVIEVTAYSNDYKNGWDLGDIVNIIKENWNVSLKQRIIEIEEVIENDNHKIFATFGSPLAEALPDEEEVSYEY